MLFMKSGMSHAVCSEGLAEKQVRHFLAAVNDGMATALFHPQGQGYTYGGSVLRPYAAIYFSPRSADA